MEVPQHLIPLAERGTVTGRTRAMFVSHHANSTMCGTRRCAAAEFLSQNQKGKGASPVARLPACRGSSMDTLVLHT